MAGQDLRARRAAGQRLTALPDHARDQLRARLAEAVRPDQTPAGLDVPGVNLVAAGRHPARFTA
ncbi:MAG: hypothetical protein ACJ75K_17845 [Actinomycetes bacterium]